MSAATLRAAATKLRKAAEGATPGPWWVDYAGEIGDKSAIIEIARWRGCLNTINLGEDHSTATYIALANPVFGLAVADWLEAVEAESFTDAGSSVEVWEAALAVARSIVGDGR